MAKKALLNPGDWVFVHIPETNETRMLKKYDGKAMVVKRKIRFGKAGGYIYELSGAKSRFDVDYWFCDEWLDLISNEK